QLSGFRGWRMRGQNNLTLLMPRRLYTKKSEYAKTRLTPRLVGFAGPEDPLATSRPAWVRPDVGDPGHFGRSAPRRRGVALSSPAPDGRSRMDSSGVDHEGHGTARAHLC